MKNLQEILSEVEKPARYIGGEYGAKEIKPDKLNYCICFPDVYEVGMSNLGIKIVSDVINSVDGAVCDRCFCPWFDFGDELKKNNIELYSLGMKKSLREFDMIGFSLQYEMSYTNILYMLDLANIPFKSCDRGEEYPIVQAGGPCAFNGEPLAEIIDIFVIGDGEDSMRELAELRLKCKTKNEFLSKAESVQGVYIPKNMDVLYGEDGKIKGFSPDKKIRKAVCENLNKACFPTDLTVGNIEAVFDRGIIEVMRGCYRGCRFCQAGFLYRPIRVKDRGLLVEQAKCQIMHSGYDELGLNSLSTGDYPELKELIRDLKKELPSDVRLSLPSLRLDSFDEEFAAESRKNSLTFAPEAGTQRLRDVINKDITVEEILFGVSEAFKSGYSKVKLYFMLGLPTETEEDLEGIVKLVYLIRDEYAKFRKNAQSLKISVSVSTFIPKPFTPFQWVEQATREQVNEKVDYLKKKIGMRGVTLSWNDYDLSRTEAVFARGDRKLNDVLITAYKKGCRFDGWSSEFKPELWKEAFIETGVNPDTYTGKLDLNDVLPWDYIDCLVDKEYMKSEYLKAYEGKVSGSCKKACKACGMQKYYRCSR